MTAPRIPSAALASVLPARTLAQNMTGSDSRVGWVSSGSGRSTSDILWSCFSILLVCTYKCIHFNVPSRKESEAGWFRWCGVYLPEKLLLWKWLKKVGWMMLIVVAPEIGVGMAVDQYLLARECRHKELQDLELPRTKESNVVEDRTKDVEIATSEVKVDEAEKQEITNTHAFFANMGGFTLRILALSPSSQKDFTQKDQSSTDYALRASLPEQGHTQNDQALSDDISHAKNASPIVHGEPLTMHEFTCPVQNWEELVFYRNTFPHLKLPSEKEINDVSKADAFTKAFACIQSGWLIIQSIVRVSVGLPITQLELATMAFVVCALTMYLLWWNKPFGVESRTYITTVAYDESVKRTIAERLYKPYKYDNYLVNDNTIYPEYFARELGFPGRGEFVSKDELDKAKHFVLKADREFHIQDLTWNQFLDLAVPFELPSEYGLIPLLGIMVGSVFGRPNSGQPNREPIVTLAFYATGTLFSAFHIAAWNWEFPSITVRMLWRIFAIAATSTYPFTLLYALMALLMSKTGTGSNELVSKIILSFVLAIYVVSRIGLMVLIFYCFASMPAGVYETVDWLQFLPHFS